MAKLKEPEAVDTTVPTETVHVPEMAYPLAELAANARKLFGVSPECVISALQIAEVDTTTLKRAKAIVEDFMNQGVK